MAVGKGKGRGKAPAKRKPAAKPNAKKVSQENPEDLFESDLVPNEPKEEEGAINLSLNENSWEEMVSIPKADLDEMRELMRQMKEQKASSTSSSDIQLLAEALKSSGNQGSIVSKESKRFDKNNQFVFSNENYSIIDESDLLDESDIVTFFTYNIYHVIASYTKNGRPIGAPYKPIEFGFLSSQREMTGKEENIVHMCRYTCKSKAELDFLKGSPEFGVVFFDNPSFSKKKASTVSRIMAKIHSMAKTGPHDLRRMCIEQGIQFSTDLDSVKSELAIKMVEKENSESIHHTQNVLNENYLEKKERERQ